MGWEEGVLCKYCYEYEKQQMLLKQPFLARKRRKGCLPHGMLFIRRVYCVAQNTVRMNYFTCLRGELRSDC